jgi:hypothetical protein
VKRTEPLPPSDDRFNKLASYALPYVGLYALLFIAAYILYKAVTGAMAATAGALPPASTNLIFERAAGLAALLYGITVVARVPRLTRKLKSRAISVAVGVLGALLYMWSVREAEGTLIGNHQIPPGGVTLGLAILVVALVFAVSVKFPSWGVIPLMAIGAACVAIMVRYYIKDTGGPLWPVFLATAASLYLWWLTALVFDLVFIWHLYIRGSRLMSRINEILGSYKERSRSSWPAERMAS